MNPDDSAHGTLDALAPPSSVRDMRGEAVDLDDAEADDAEREFGSGAGVRDEGLDEADEAGGVGGAGSARSLEGSERGPSASAVAGVSGGSRGGAKPLSAAKPSGVVGAGGQLSGDQIDPATLDRAEAILKHTFADRSLLERALTHASISSTRHHSNERLEFLGDSVLGLIVCEYLYANYPDLLEGDMTKIKSDAVSRKKCARIAQRLGLDEMLLIGKGMQTRSSLPSSLSAAVVESLLGALYIEAGIVRVREFLLPLIGPMIDEIAASGHHQNFKSVLQQHAQQSLGVQPVYALLEERGPDHDKLFLVAVDLGVERHEACWSRSKKQAEQAAAQKALVALGVLVESPTGGLVCGPLGGDRAEPVAG